MLQKFVVALLVLTVLGAAGVGIYDATQNNNDDMADVLANPMQGEPFAASDSPSAPVNEVTTQTVAQAAEQPLNQPTSQVAVQLENPAQSAPVPQIAETPVQQQPIQEQQVQAVSMVGDPWSGIGTITALDDTGITLQRAEGSEIYVELGPSHYWQDLGATLAIGDQVTVIGFFNGEQYHAASVYKTDGAQLALRTETGQPLWSGGGNSTSTLDANGNTNGNGNAAESQVAPEDWVTVDGVVSTVDAQVLTMQTQTGEYHDLELGSADFMAEQGVSFVPGNPISVVGFWQEGVFRAGEITKTMTGERLMLLDPNGRPLWAGPGRAGNNGGGGQGQSGQSGNGGGQGQSENGQSQDGQGNNGGGQGQGQGQNVQEVVVPAEQWETVTGEIVQVEVPGRGMLSFIYMTDPEGNIIELQA